MNETDSLRIENDALADALRDVIGTCGPFSPRGTEAVRRAKALLAKIDHRAAQMGRRS